jgi:uncharacterized membrane protein
MMNKLFAVLLLTFCASASAAETVTTPVTNMPSAPVSTTTSTASTISAAVVGLAAPAPAPTTLEDGYLTEKCYGIARAGKNECTPDDIASCSVSVKDGEGYLILPKGLCDRIVGGSLTGKY